MEEIINSVMQSPENTNPNVLRSQLSKMGGGSGGGKRIFHADSATNTIEPNLTAEDLIGSCLDFGGMYFVCIAASDMPDSIFIAIINMFAGPGNTVIEYRYFPSDGTIQERTN